jgi:hypothetical protein
MLYAFFNHHCDCVYDQGQASADEYGSLHCVRADGCGRWRVAFPGTSDRDGHRHAYASAHAQSLHVDAYASVFQRRETPRRL